MSDITAAAISPPVSLESRLQLAQAVAGSLFAVFVLLHLSNIAVAPFGSEVFNNYQRAIRTFYQFPLVELVVVIGPLVVHAAAGIWLFLLQRRQPRTHRRPWAARLQTWAGCFLLLVIIGHVAAVRGPSFFLGIYPEFEGLAYSMWYLPYYFYPYYFLLALAGFYHATNGLRTLALRRGMRVSIGVQKSISLIAAVWITMSLLSFGGILVEVTNPADNDFARLLGEIFDSDPTKPIRL